MKYLLVEKYNGRLQFAKCEYDPIENCDWKEHSKMHDSKVIVLSDLGSNTSLGLLEAIYHSGGLTAQSQFVKG